MGGGGGGGLWFRGLIESSTKVLHSTGLVQTVWALIPQLLLSLFFETCTGSSALTCAD